MTFPLTLRSPAKINLFLKIVSRRPDGYHNLASLFQAVDLCDTLHFTPAASDKLTCDDPALPTDGSNLIHKAVQLFRRRTNWQQPLSITLEKRIPFEAGLGGGSSNVATTLFAMNQLSHLNVPLATLAAWGSEIGSDVAFFLSEGTAYCTGRGEILQPLPPLSPQSLWIIKPSYGLSTPAVYKTLNLSTVSSHSPEQALAQFRSGSFQLFNDLEQPAFALMPELLAVKNQLLACGFPQVLLCGSGSALFSLGASLPPALPNVRLFPAKFLTRAPFSWY